MRGPCNVLMRAWRSSGAMRRMLFTVVLALLCGAVASAEESVAAKLVVLSGGGGQPGGRAIEHVTARTSADGTVQTVAAWVIGNRIAVMHAGRLSLETVSPRARLWTAAVPVQSTAMDATGAYAISDGYLIKIRLADGRIVARRYVGSRGALLAADGRNVFATVAPAQSPPDGKTFGFKLAAFDTGKLGVRWKAAIEMTPQPDAMLKDNSIIVTSAGSGAYISFALQAFNRATGRRQWEQGGAFAAIAGFHDDSVFVQDHWMNLDAYDPLTVTQIAQDTGRQISRWSYAPDPKTNFQAGENAPFGSAKVAGNALLIHIDGHASYLYQLGANPQRSHPLRLPDDLQYVDAIGNRLYFERSGVLGQVLVNDRTLLFRPLDGARVASFAGMSAMTSATYGYVVDAASHRVVARVPSPCRGAHATALLSAKALVLKCWSDSVTVYTP